MSLLILRCTIRAYSEEGKVADVIPIYKNKILPDACTTIEDVKELINHWHNRHPEDKGMSPHISVVIDII